MAATTDSKVDLGMIVREIDKLMVLNDEAHHIHDAELAWFKSIQDIHNRMLQKDGGLSLQVDVTATPRANNGTIFVQTVCDYPLMEAIAQNVVKHPVLPDAPSRTPVSCPLRRRMRAGQCAKKDRSGGALDFVHLLRLPRLRLADLSPRQP